MGTGASARYYLGLAETRLGQFAHARELLLPFLPPGRRRWPGRRLRWSSCAARWPTRRPASGDAPAAIELWDAYARGGREPEKAYARERISGARWPALPGRARCRPSGRRREKGLARALLGAAAASRFGAAATARGRRRSTSETAVGTRGDGDRAAGRARRHRRAIAGRLGLALALSGKFQPVGEAAMRAAMLATGAPARARACSCSCATRAATPERAGDGVDGAGARRSR